MKFDVHFISFGFLCCFYASARLSGGWVVMYSILVCLSCPSTVSIRSYCEHSILKNKKLSCHRDRIELRVIGYFTKSLKVTQDHWQWHLYAGRV